MVYFSHPVGNANVRAALKGLADAHLLSRYYTTIAAFPNTVFGNLSRFPLFSEIGRRSYDPCLKAFTHAYPLYEIGRLLSIKSGFSKLIEHETGIFSVDQIFQGLDRKMAKDIQYLHSDLINAVYCYEDGAQSTFKVAKQKNLQCLYDLPIGYWRAARKLLEEEKAKWPEWISTLTNFKDSDAKLSRKDEELKLADTIYVASSFTAKTLADFPGTLAKVEVIPYGFPDVNVQKDYTGLANRKKLKLLFVGGLSQRKGIANLFAAADNLKDYLELTIVGKKSTNECGALNHLLTKHSWIPSLPHQDVLQLMRQYDVLVFPSLFEGFGLVITEAMSQGMPVITTERTAGPDLIEHGHNGWLTEAGSTDALQEAIEYFLKHPLQIAMFGKEAQATAHKRPWQVYGTELALTVAKNIYQV